MVKINSHSLTVVQELYQKDTLMLEVLKSKDELFMYQFFDFLSQVKHMIYLLKAPKVPFLATYLAERQGESADCAYYLALLLRHSGKYMEAILKYKELAETTK